MQKVFLYGIILDNILSMNVMYYFYPFNKNIYVIMSKGSSKNYNVYFLNSDIFKRNK